MKEELKCEPHYFGLSRDQIFLKCNFTVLPLPNFEGSFKKQPMNIPHCINVVQYHSQGTFCEVTMASIYLRVVQEPSATSEDLVMLYISLGLRLLFALNLRIVKDKLISHFCNYSRPSAILYFI